MNDATPGEQRLTTRDLAAALALAVLSAALFGAAASLFLLLLGLVRTEFDAAADPSGLALRALFFAGLAFLALSSVLNYGRSDPAPRRARIPWQARDFYGLWLLLVVAGLLVFPRLDEYPFVAPDESHHLIVARNLAEHEAYASGHVGDALNYFDAYDSVGPPLIGATAQAFRWFGVSLSVGRGVVAVHGVLLLALVYIWVRRYAGPGAATLAGLGVLFAYSTLYLSRTFYGEVPAMLYLVAGLMIWEATRTYRSQCFAGLLLGCAVLTKPIFILIACCGLVALIATWARGERPCFKRLAAVALGIAIPIVGWSVVQAVGQTEDRSMLGIYQHYLLFGLEPVAANVLWMANDAPVGYAVYLLLTLVAGGWLLRHGASPAALTLWLSAPLFLQWWIAYTPGQLPRYLWPVFVVSGIAWGAAMAYAWKQLFAPDTLRPVLAVVALAVLVTPPAFWLGHQLPELRLNREMTATRELVDYLSAKNEQATIATTDYASRGAMQFLSGRYIAGGPDAAELLKTHDWVIVRSGSDPALDQPDYLFYGREYAVLEAP